MTTPEDANNITIGSAIEDFHQARNRAKLKDLLARLTGESTQLLSFDQVRHQLKLHGSVNRGLREIPLDAIVGSVGRYTDFTRDFLPRRDSARERWTRVKVIASDLAGMPPIDVYKVGEAYFVVDGNHRVSVARQLGASHIQAYVTEVQSRVPLTPDTSPDDLILKAEYANFLEQTQIDKLRPGSDLSVSVPGQYQILLEHIEVHQYFMEIETLSEISYDEAVMHFYDFVYLPVVRIIRALGILRQYPGRTETDLYLWVSKHRRQLAEQFGWEIPTEYAASDLADREYVEKHKLLDRMSQKIIHIILSDTLEAGPPAGEWRQSALADGELKSLFTEILVPVNGHHDGWYALDQALVVAHKENARLHGLHIVAKNAEKKSNAARAVRKEFDQRCAWAEVDGKLTIAAGEIAHEICRHATGADLVITNLAHPPGARPLSRLSSGFRSLIQQCPRPVLATPRTVSPLDKALLSYDGSPKADEALFIAAYLAKHWKVPLVVAAIQDENGKSPPEALARARHYLDLRGQDEHLEITYLIGNGPVGRALLEIAEKQRCTLLVMGGYGRKPVFEVFLGSTVDHILRASRQPTLICR